MPIKTLGLLEKIRVGRETRNTHIFLPYRYKVIIKKSLDPLRAKKTFIRKKLGHTMVSAMKASSVTL